MVDLVIRVVLLIPAFVAAGYGTWRAMRSIDITREIAPADKSKPRFQLVDFMALFMMMQIPILMMTAVFRDEDASNVSLWVMSCLYALIYAGIWWWGVAALSVIEVNSSVRRAAFLGVLQPLGMGLILAGGAAMLMAPPAVWSGEIDKAIQALVGMFAYALAAVAYSFACDWVRAGSERLNPPTPAEDAAE